MKIDERSVVPLGWVLTGFATCITIAGVGAFWVSAVNFRLQRIEERLGIPMQEKTSVINRSLNSAFGSQEAQADGSSNRSQ